MKSIMIVGGLGHIGSAVINNLRNRYDLTVVDDLSSERYCSLFKLSKYFKFINQKFADITKEQLKDIDVVLHLGAKTNAVSSFNDPSVLDVNVTQTKKLIDTVKKSNVKLFIFPSSTSVYGKSKKIMYEDDDNINPQSPYAECKVTIEEYIQTKDLNHVIFRFGTIFGTSVGMRFHTAINKFCFQATFNQPLIIWKENYSQYRPYLGINDAITAIKLAISNSKMWNTKYNVLTGNFKLDEIITSIKKFRDIKVNFVNTPLLNQLSYFVSFDKIKKYGFIPKDSLKKHINRTINLLEGK